MRTPLRIALVGILNFLVVNPPAMPVARGAIIGSSGTASFTVSKGGVPFAASGPLAVPDYPAVAAFAAADPGGTAGFGALAVSSSFSPSQATVFIPNTGPLAIASQGAPAALDGPLSVKATFLVTFTIDAGGTPATTVKIAYPIAFGSIPGTSDAFDAEVDYTSASAGFLGTSEVHFAAILPPGSPYLVVSGLDLALPALLGPDTLTLSGFFELKADGFFPGGSAEIEVFGVPEPACIVLLAIGCPALLALRRRR